MEEPPDQQRTPRTNRSVSPAEYGVQIYVPEGAPRWITPELMEDTWRTWQPFYKETLTMDDALEIITNVVRLADLLVEPPQPSSPAKHTN